MVSNENPNSIMDAFEARYWRPFTETLPLVGRSSPAIIRVVVVLPAMFGHWK